MGDDGDLGGENTPSSSLPSRIIAAASSFPPVRFGIKYKDVLSRVAVTVSMLFIIRSGNFVPLPGVDMSLVSPPEDMGSEGERLIRALYGQVHALPASLFDLGISPFINASIIMVILLVMPNDVLKFQWLGNLQEAKKQGKGGDALLNLWINRMALLMAAYLALQRAIELQPSAVFAYGFIPLTALSLVAGSCVMHFCAGIVTAFGLGNGTSLVICTGIVTEYSKTLTGLATGVKANILPLWKLGIVSLGYIAMVIFAIYLTASELRLPILQYSTTVITPPGPKITRRVGEVSPPPTNSFSQLRTNAFKKIAKRLNRTDYYPLQLNTQGMMPMIFAGALYFGFLPKGLELLGFHAMAEYLYLVQNSFFGLIFYGLLVFGMEFLPVAGIKPKEISEYFSLMSVGIQGVVPGKPTEDHMKEKLMKCKFWGGLALGGLAITAALFDQLCQSFLGTTLATTSLLIIVGAVVATTRQLSSLLDAPALSAKLKEEEELVKNLAS